MIYFIYYLLIVFLSKQTSQLKEINFKITKFINKRINNINEQKIQTKLKSKLQMTTYKEKYHLKKTQPINNKQRIPYLSKAKQVLKSQKTTSLKSSPLTKIIKNRQQKDKQIFVEKKQNVSKKQVMKQEKQQISKQSQNQRSQVTRYDRLKSSNLKKYSQSNNQSLQYWKKSSINLNFNLLSSVQNFFNRIIKPDNGCVCEEPCEWAQKLFKWVDIPQLLVLQHYQVLREKVHQKFNKGNHTPFDRLAISQIQQLNEQKQKSFKQIRKDIDRTHSTSDTFRNPVFKRRVENILKCYVVEDLNVGYIQGMNMILAGILYHVKSEAKTYGIFRKLLYSIRSIYLDNFRQCYVHISRIQKLLKQYLFDVYQLFQDLQIEISMICLPWVISLLTSIVPLEYSHLIFYGFIKQRWNFIYRTCLSLFIYFKDSIKEAGDASEVLTMLTASQEQYKTIDWEDIIKYGQNIEISFTNNNNYIN